jgi:hypothetical protein
MHRAWESIIIVKWQRIAATGFCAGLALPAFPASGQTVRMLFAAGATPIYAGVADRQAVGSLTPGTPLEAAEPANGGYQPFTLVAWSQEGDAETIVAAQGQRIVLATVTAKAHIKTISTATDDYGNVWNQVELTAFAPAKRLTPNQDAVWARAHALYSKRCSACHALHATTEFTANQWPAIVKTMSKNAALQPAEAALITQYVQTHAR